MHEVKSSDRFTLKSDQFECVNIFIEIVIMDAQQNFSSLPDTLPSLSEVSDALLQSERFQLLHEKIANSPRHI